MTADAVLLLGDINIDSFWPVPEFPVPGRDGLVEEVKFEVGGAALNSAIVLDRLGVKTRMLSCLGKDRWADQIGDELKRSGIDMTSVQFHPSALTGINFTIVTADGERTMFTHRGANKQYHPDLIKEEVFTDAALLHISGYALMESPQKDAVWRAVELARRYSVPVSVDTGLEPVIKQPDDFRKLLHELTICITGLEEVNALFGSSTPEDGANALTSLGVEIAAIKLGSKGSLVAQRKKQIRVPCFEVEVIDTTGAGDSYSAGLVYGLLSGLPVENTAMLASALGALAASVNGAGMSLPGKRELINFLKSIANIDDEWVERGIHKLLSVVVD
jgi:ribokinase